MHPLVTLLATLEVSAVPPNKSKADRCPNMERESVCARSETRIYCNCPCSRRDLEELTLPSDHDMQRYQAWNFYGPSDGRSLHLLLCNFLLSRARGSARHGIRRGRAREVDPELSPISSNLVHRHFSSTTTPYFSGLHILPSLDHSNTMLISCNNRYIHFD